MKLKKTKKGRRKKKEAQEEEKGKEQVKEVDEEADDVFVHQMVNKGKENLMTDTDIGV